MVQRERRLWDEDEISYHRRRADEELERAEQAQCLFSRRFHYHLAALHLDRAHGASPFMMRAA
jgi:hypothetical protein